MLDYLDPWIRSRTLWRATCNLMESDALGCGGGREGVDLDLVECGPIESSGSTCVCFVSNGIP